jgi:excisionase family DNA binding protein
MHTIRSAARALGTAKSTIYRAVRAGRLPALKLANGTYAIYPGELRRAFPRDTAVTSAVEDHLIRAIPTWDVS